jgi:hypothetical protein
MPKEKGPEAFSLTPEYSEAKKEFGLDVLDNTQIGLREKLKKLKDLAEKIGNNANNSADFENFLGYWIKAKDRELYEAYMESLENLRDAA